MAGLPRLNPNEKYEQMKYAAHVARLPHEREAWLNLAFFLNQQYSEWHQEEGQDGYIRAIPKEKGTERHPRMVFNKIMHFVRTAQADALQDRPTGDVLPPTSDYMDLSDARVARAWIEDQADASKTNYNSRLGRAVWWAMIAGSGYLKWQWSKERGLMIPAPSFFEVYLDPYAKEFDDGRYIIHSQFLDVEQVYDAYGIETKAVKLSGADQAKSELLRGMGSAPVLNGVVVNEIWHKPSRRYPEGLYTVWTGRQTLIAPTKLPYPHLIEDRLLPFTQLGVIERGDSAYYASPVTYLRPPQMELNVFHNQIIQNRKNFANGKWWIDEALDMDTDPDDSPHQILRGRASVPGVKPELIQGAVFPNNGDAEMIEMGMMHVVGQREISQGQVPGRVEAAKAIELLKEADAGALKVLRDTIQASNDQGWYHALQLARTFQTQADMVRSYSKEGIPEVKHFRAGEMKPGFRVRTTMTTALARSRANRQDLLLRLWDSKVIQDPEVMADLLEMPLPNTLSDKAEDVMLARNENLTLAEGKAITPNSWDEHAVHIREHNAYRKTSEYQMLDDDAKKRFEHHVQGHESLQEIQLMRQVKLQMIAQGGQAPQPTTPGDAPTQPSETPTGQEA